jgi:hypothetical protein
MKEQTFKTMLQAARKRTAWPGQNLHAFMYCENSRCDVREVQVHLKESYGPPHVDSGPKPKCPFCGHELNCHRVLTAGEFDDQEERDARSSVNAQRWRRDHGVGAMPLSVFMDETLPA